MDIAAMNAMLDAAYGTSAAAHCPTSHDLALFYGDPRDLGVELESEGGYARVAVAAADWAAAADGEKSTLDWVAFPTATDEWSSEATHWALFDGSVLWDSGPLVEPLNVTGPGAGPLVRIAVRFADSIVPEEE